MNLNTLRKEIEDIDKLIIECLAKRENISTKIGEIKREMGSGAYGHVWEVKDRKSG